MLNLKFMKEKKSLCRCTIKNSKEYKRINDMEKFMKVLSDRTRLRILCLLKNNELNVKSIHEEIGIGQTLASHHLTQIKKLGLLKSRSYGTSTMYSIDKKKIETYCNLMKEMVDYDLKDGKCC